MPQQRVSSYRSTKQQEAFDRAVSVGYIHNRDADYKLGRRGDMKGGCLIVLFGNVTGSERAMIIYPDGSVVTQPPHRGGSDTITFNRTKLAAAIATHGVPLQHVRRGRLAHYVATPRPAEQRYTDEDEVFRTEGGHR